MGNEKCSGVTNDFISVRMSNGSFQFSLSNRSAPSVVKDERRAKTIVGQKSGKGSKEISKLTLFRRASRPAFVEPCPHGSYGFIGTDDSHLQRSRGSGIAQIERSVPNHPVTDIDVCTAVSEFEVRLGEKAQIHNSSPSSVSAGKNSSLKSPGSSARPGSAASQSGS